MGCRRHSLGLARRLLLLALISFAAIQTSTSQDATRPDGSPPKTYKLEGTVLNSVTGEPLRRALVEVTSSDWPPVLTGSDGKFVFENLPEQEWTLQVTKPGFFTKGEDNNFQVKAGETPVTLFMAPEAVVAGRVETREGEPVERAVVRVMAANFNMGRVQYSQIGQAVTDEDGNFRVADLNARRCWLVVQPSQISVRTFANDVQGIKEGYPAVVYYPAARDLSSATPIPLLPGREAEAKFALSSEPIFQVSGTTIGSPPGQYPQVRVLTPSGENLMLPVQVNQQTGTFEIRRVPAGTYVLQSSARDPEQHLLNAEVTVTVQSNVTDVNMVLAAAKHIPVIVHTDFSASSPQVSAVDDDANRAASLAHWSRIELRSLEPVHQEMPRFQFGPNYEAHDVVPGKYAVELISSGDIYYVQSARSGSVDLLRDPLIVPHEGDVPPIELVVRDDGATISGTVHGAKPGGGFVAGVPVGAVVVVLPEKSSIQTPRMTMVYGEPAHFAISGLPPGDYRVFAFDAAEQIEYSNPTVLAGYSSKGVRVTVSARGHAEVDVDFSKNW